MPFFNRVLPQRLRVLSLGILPLMVALSACSSTESQPAEPKAVVSANVPASLQKTLGDNLKAAGISAKIMAIKATEMQNMYWVSFEDMPPLFVSGDGLYVIQGDVMRLGKNKVSDISAPMVQGENSRLLQSIPLKDEIVFAPEGKPRAVAYVFTDADCGYCRKLHSEMAQINAKGIEVRYLAWPRSAQSMPDMNAVWCSEDRKSAMNQAKQGMPVQAAACENPVMQQRKIGAQMGVNGTPAVYSPQGEYLGGYMPADELAKKLGL